jgi:hypothetical protein
VKNDVIHVDGAEVREGTSIYDTKFDRVLWISDIDEHEITVEPLDPYEDDDPIWWSVEGDPTRVGEGASIGIDKLESLVERGRFEVGPQPRGR